MLELLFRRLQAVCTELTATRSAGKSTEIVKIAIVGLSCGNFVHEKTSDLETRQIQNLWTFSEVGL